MTEETPPTDPSDRLLAYLGGPNEITCLPDHVFVYLLERANLSDERRATLMKEAMLLSDLPAKFIKSQLNALVDRWLSGQIDLR